VSGGAPDARAPRPRPAPRRGRVPGALVHLLLAVLCWAALAGLVYATDPAEVLPRAAFFLSLFGALFFTLAPLLRAITPRFSRSRVYQEASSRHATRQALMLSAFVVLNALLLMVRAWSGFNALLLFGMFAVIEIVALARR
jgi:hypothetical protein